MAKFIDTGTGDAVSNWGELLQRKIFFIHGTVSNNRRWNTSRDARKVMNIIGFAPSKSEWDSFMTPEWEERNCDYGFSWEDLAGQFNSVINRATASDRLVEYVLGKANTATIDEVVLVGHSHGGNVAIQAADRLSEQYAKVYIITVGTPAQNKETFFSMAIISNLTKLILWATDGHHFYKNPENPVNWENNKNNIVHLALWNSKDSVDEFALVLDHVVGGSLELRYSGMTFLSDYYYTNGITQNIRFDIDIRADIKAESVFIEWVSKLNTLYSVLYRYCVDCFRLPNLPQLRTFSEYQFGTQEERHQTRYAARADALYVHINQRIDLMPIGYSARNSQPLRDARFNRLFLDEADYFLFLEKIDKTQPVISPIPTTTPPSGLIEQFRRYNCYDTHIIGAYSGFGQISAALTDTHRERYEVYRQMVKIDSYPNHGFDLAKPSEIQQAIEKGIIVPFARNYGYL